VGREERTPDQGRRRKPQGRGSNYAIEDTIETGHRADRHRGEVRSATARPRLRKSYADTKDGEIWLINANIPPNICRLTASNHEPKRPRKLLLHRKQINKLMGAVDRDGMTLIFSAKTLFQRARARAKLLLAVAKGKKLHEQGARERKESATGVGEKGPLVAGAGIRTWAFMVRDGPQVRLLTMRFRKAACEARMNQKNLLEVDWSKIPAPSDDGAAKHLAGKRIPSLSLLATDDHPRSICRCLLGRTRRVRLSPEPASPARSAWSMIGT